jgi:hypothetical protein
MAGDIRAWRYTADNGEVYQYGVAAYIGAQENPPGTAVIGGTAQAQGTRLHPLPRGMKPRHVRLVNAGGTKSRSVVCMTNTAPLFVGTISTLTLQDGEGTDATYTVYSATGERTRARKPLV